MNLDFITFEPLTQSNISRARKIRRDDISEAFVDTVDTIMELTQYGLEHHCKGHTYAIKQENAYIGLILLGEAFAWYRYPILRIKGGCDRLCVFRSHSPPLDHPSVDKYFLPCYSLTSPS